MDRRTYLKYLSIATGGVFIAPQVLVSCKDDRLLFSSTHTHEPFSSLEEMRHTVRINKGHLEREMYRLIKNKEAQEIFKFVTSRFATIPSSKHNITNAAYNQRWGRRGLLRCGKGTLREKSDLLFFMLSEAGLKPEYFRQHITLNEDLIDKAFCVEKEDNHTLEAVPEFYVNKWSKALVDNDAVAIEVENGLENSQTLAKQLATHLPEGAHDQLEHFNWLNTDGIDVPIIRITENDQIKDLNVFEMKSFQDFSIVSDRNELFKLDHEQAHKIFENVKITIHATYSNNLNTPLELVAGEWDIETLIGRQVAVQFVPPIASKHQLHSQFHELNQFVPFLTLRDPEMDTSHRKNQTFSGVGFDMFGNTFTKDNEGKIRTNGFRMNPIKENSRPLISSLNVKLIDDFYPIITIKVAPLNAKGQPVLGLGGHVFSIKDQDQEQQAVISQNQIIPHVLVLFDNTASMPYPYAYNEFPEELNTLITLTFEREFSNFAIETATFGTDFTTALQSITVAKYDYILCFGDGEAFDMVSAKELKQLLKHTPIAYHYINNQSVGQSSKRVSEVFRSADYPFYRIQNLQRSLIEASKRIRNKGIYPYTLTYNAPFDNDNLIHKVQVGITESSKVRPVNVDYIIDRERTYATAPFPCGLSLTIAWEENGDTQRIFRHLVGFDIRTDVASPQALEGFKTDLKSYLLGTHLLCFEADKPTLPTLLDDFLTASLTQAPLALDENASLQETIKKLENTYPLPIKSLAAFCGIQNAVSSHRVTFENRFQTCLYSEYYDSRQQSSVIKTDMLPTSDVRTFASSKKEAYYKTLENTALLALSEANLFATSTLSDLKNKPLKLFDNRKIAHDLYPIFKYNKDYYYHIIYDATLHSNSYWQINKYTGALLGMLPDGSGGGSIIEKQRLDMALKIWETWTNLLVKVTKGGMTMGLVAAYGMFLAELYGVVALEVNNLGAGTDFEKDINELLIKYAKKSYKKVKKGMTTKP